MTDKALILIYGSTKYKKIAFHLILLEIKIIAINAEGVNYSQQKKKKSIHCSLLIPANVFGFSKPIYSSIN